MDIASLPIPAPLVTAYRERGITSLYPPQADCIEKGLLTGKNLLISIPTASGKTLLAEMAMWTRIAAGGKCLYIVPLRALAAEKYDEFRQRQGVRVGIATGDFDRTDNYLGNNDIVVATSEKVDSLLRNRTGWLSRITCMILDEVHLIGSENRGVTLEMVIAKMRYANPAMQIIGLSATIGNPGELATWMDAALVTSAWRPVDLRQGVFFDGKIRFGESERPVRGATKHDDLNLCLDTIEEGGQCLVFVSSRRNAEGFAKKAAVAIKTGTPDSKALAEELRSLRDRDKSNVLADCVERGCAFHHAGLLRQERTLIEEGFRKGYIEVISATPTLAAGLNLPARRVVIRDYLRFTAGAGMVPIPVMEYHQMAGRAGRPHLDPYGEAVLIAKDRVTAENLREEFIEAGAEDIRSMITDEPILGAHILSLIATGFARDEASLTDFMNRTFYAFQHPKSRSMPRVVGDLTRSLVRFGFVRDEEGTLSATLLGSLVSQLYIDPRGGRAILDHLSSAEEVTLTGLLHLLCTTPDMTRLYLKAADTQYLKTFLFRNGTELIVPLPYEQDEEEIWLSALKTALVLTDYADEVPEALIEERYGIGAGDLYNIIEGAKWLLHAADRLVSAALPDRGNVIGEIALRVQHGIRKELLPLIAIRNIGRVRARRLFSAGMTTPARVAEAGLPAVSRILGQNLARQILAEIGAGKRGSGERIPMEEERDDLTSLPAIGEVTAGKLKENGILTVTDLLRTDEAILAGIIGSRRTGKILEYLEQEGRSPDSSPSGQQNPDSVKRPSGQQSIMDFQETTR